MPNLKTIDIGEWGDMVLVRPLGRIYTLDGFGKLKLCFGSPVEFDTSEPSGLNDDGNSNTCCQIAFGHLGLDNKVLKKFRQENPDKGPPRELLHELLVKAGAKKIQFKGTVGKFLQDNPTGKFFVSCYSDYGENFSHAFAVINGNAFNITFQTPDKQIKSVWKIGEKAAGTAEEQV